jgi:hypothetical protein
MKSGMKKAVKKTLAVMDKQRRYRDRHPACDCTCISDQGRVELVPNVDASPDGDWIQCSCENCLDCDGKPRRCGTYVHRVLLLFRPVLAGNRTVYCNDCVPLRKTST